MSLPTLQQRVLIVDDQRRNQQLLEIMLGPEGHIVDFASSGDQALAMVAASAPDLILLDVMMPGMDGFEVVRRLKGEPSSKNIPIIMVTALDDRAARLRGLDAGAEDFLSKPVDRAELCARVRNLLRLKAYGEYFDKKSRQLQIEVGSRSAELLESQHLYGTTFESVPIGIAVISEDGRWLRVNQSLCELLGCEEEDLPLSPVEDLLGTEHDGADNVVKSLLSGKASHHVIEERQFQRADGSSIWTRINISVHRGEPTAVLHFILVVEDITERRRLEAQIRQDQKLNAIGRLAAGVAHDFNNLLAVILGYAESIIGAGGLPPRDQQDLGEIVTAASSAARLTGQLLAFGRQQMLNAEPVDLNELIRDTSRMVSRLMGSNIEVALDLTAQPASALADRGKIEQVLMNLLINARDAMPNGGKVTVSSANLAVGDGTPDSEVVPGKYVKILVRDTGIGMDKATLGRIFEPFFTTKQIGRGTGLGLSTTYGIVKQSNGAISVQSEVGRGTTFRITLPASNGSPHAEAPAAVVASGTASPTETVLLVEDELAVRRLSARILKRAGYSVVEADDGADAERLFALQDFVNLLITDVMMPICGGPALVARLRQHNPELRVLYVSGYTDTVAELHRDDINSGFLQKPFASTELLSQTRRLLGTSRAGRSGGDR